MLLKHFLELFWTLETCLFFLESLGTAFEFFRYERLPVFCTVFGLCHESFFCLGHFCKPSLADDF